MHAWMRKQPRVADDDPDPEAWTEDRFYRLVVWQWVGCDLDAARKRWADEHEEGKEPNRDR